jgi:YD repeat-containing protein
MNTLHNSLLVVATLVSSVAVSSQTKPNFTGTWELNVQKSDLGGAPITKLAAQIEHKDPALKFIVVGQAGGEDFTETETYSTDGTPTTNARGDQVKVHWDGATLVIETTAPDGNALDASRITLSDDGTNLMRDYERKTANDAQKRHEIYDKH